jgi:TetR/AcrR family transcriptional regulator, ethionamide resistance regulator
MCHTVSNVSSPHTKAEGRESRERARARIIEAAPDLMRERSYAELSVGVIMARAGLGRTLFYRHFDDLGDLLIRANREPVQEMYSAQNALAAPTLADGPEATAAAARSAIELAVAVYLRHGPLLRAVAEAALSDERIAVGQAAFRARFDALATRALREQPRRPLADAAETAVALNRLNEGYLLDAFGREPRVSAETAVQTLSEIWDAVITG